MNATTGLSRVAGCRHSGVTAVKQYFGTVVLLRNGRPHRHKESYKTAFGKTMPEEHSDLPTLPVRCAGASIFTPGRCGSALRDSQRWQERRHVSALAGLLRQGDAAIPCTRITARIQENAEAIGIQLDAWAMQRT